jgi:hypothetical protein
VLAAPSPSNDTRLSEAERINTNEMLDIARNQEPLGLLMRMGGTKSAAGFVFPYLSMSHG